MKKIYYSVILQLVIVISVFAGSNNTIVIDGINNGWTADETFTNCSSAENAYFTWDADNIYLGISADEADYDNIATFVYFDTDPLGSDGSTTAYAWGENITTPFNSDYVIVFKNGLTNPADYIQVMRYNNSTFIWDEIYTVTGELYILDVTSTDTVVKFNVGTDYRELKVNRSYIGNPEAIKTCTFTEEQWGLNWRYMVWPSNGWVDANRTSGQSIPHYYGFFPESGISPNRSPYFDASFDQWTGAAKSTTWADAGNWSNGIPTSSTLVKLPATATVIVDAAGAECDDILMKTGATLTVNTDGTLTSNGGIYNYTGSTGVVVQSSLSGNGSLIEYGFGNTLMTVQCYTTAGQWHSFAAPVSGQTSNELYLGGSPDVWLAEYNEPTRDYTFITEFTEPLDDAKGWMLWVGGTGDHTYDFQGLARESVQGENNNATRSAIGTDYGFAYVGNPFPSAIDWDASLGWTKTNLNNAIYIRNGSSWVSYVDGVGNPDGVGTQYIAMNQGFFVQVTDNNAPPESGTLKMSRQVCVHDDVVYLKTTTTIDSLIRLKLDQFGNSDEAVVRFINDATEGFDGQYDAAKFFSYSDNQPLIFSESDSNTYSISSLPHSVQEVSIDVSGINGISMTISATEINSFNNVYLKDELTGIVTNLIVEDYTFTYDTNFVDRFKLYFTLTGNEEITDNELIFNTFSFNREITVQINNTGISEISIVNMLGQQVFHSQTSEPNIVTTVNNGGFYLVNVRSGEKSSTKKVFVK